MDDGRCQQTEVYDALSEGVKTVPPETWLQVVPQLIARIDTPRKFVSSLICRVLADIGKAHPQVNPLLLRLPPFLPLRRVWLCRLWCSR